MSVLTGGDRALLDEGRRATLATVDESARPRLVPVCYVLDPDDDRLWIPLDEKPKIVDDVRDLARVRDLIARPAVSLLVDRWSEDWEQLAWLRLHGSARLIEPADVPPSVIAGLRQRYPQYRQHALDGRPAIRVDLEAAQRWRAEPGEA
ncbi:MAG TPA: pyridoxamine 5'-phosphate oxidase family protein [Candidatus Saccharimonadales bacterium]|nr:pyridoxamine 5'-phosphate oxidase family protein [Candidatus Saccharimonadales bacterium]